MTQKARRDGFPVLAFSDLDNPAPVSSSFLFKSKPNHATLSLKSMSSHPGHSDKLTFFLQINPGDLVPSKLFLQPANIPLPSDLLHIVQRNGNPQISTLCLTLGRRCSIWYPKTITITPASGVHPTLDRLASLATARTLYLLFDENWLSPEPKKLLRDFVFHPEKVLPYPVEEYYKNKNELLNWTLFSSPAYHDFTTDQVDPTPPYSGAAVKRLRRTSNQTPSPPRVKRLLTSPDPVAIDTSENEEDGTTTPHTQLENSTTGSRRASTRALSSSPCPGTPRQDLRLAVDKAIESSLTGRMGNLIPSLLAQLVAAPSPTPSEQSMGSHRSTPPPPPPGLTPFGEMLGDYVSRQIKREFENIYKHTQSHADHLRSVADDEFYNRLEDERLALHREADTKFEEFKQKCEDLEEQTTERVEWRVNEIFERLGEYEHADDSESEGIADVESRHAKLKKERAKLRRKSAKMRMDAEDLRRERDLLRRDKDDLWRREEQLRREQRALEREKQLHARTVQDSLEKERDSLLPELPGCCVLP